MVRKDKLGLGLLVSLFATSTVLAETKETVIGTFKAEEPKEIAKDIAASASSSDSQKAGSLSSNDTKETTDATQASGSKEGQNLPEATPTSAQATETTDSQFEKKLIDILNKNPKIIVNAIQNYKKIEDQALKDQMEASLMKYKEEISKESSAALLGKKDAAVKLVVFLDPNCPHCRPFTQALHKVRESFPDVGILVRHWAILGKDSEEVIRGLWAIKQQGPDKFNAACKAIASSDEKYTYPKLLAWVEDHNLNVDKFKEDSESTATKKIVEDTSKLAKDLGLQGTPTSLLIDKNGIRPIFPTDEKSLEEELKGASGPSKT